ncbi:MAG: TonB-dependent receptor plug domain-containing protein, partial [Litorimonas sp.]
MLVVVGSQSPAFAQDNSSADTSVQAVGGPKEIYLPDFFITFQPRTAEDMIARVPGFTVTGNDAGGRGFGQANLNLLINGRRPSSKSSGANQILGRIPADNVVQIEILDGASLDIPGLSGQVANIITKSTTKLSGNWGYSARWEEGTAPQILEGNLSVAGSRGDLDFVLSVESRQFTVSENGFEQFFNGDGVQTQDRVEDINFRITRPVIDANLTWDPDNGHVANLNLSSSLGNRNQTLVEDFTVLFGDEISGQSQNFSGEDEWVYEVGGDYAFPLGPGTLKIIALNRFENSDSGNRFVNNLNDEIPTLSIFENDQDEGEFIGRLEYNFKPFPKQDLQISVEGAFNFLESDTLFFETGDIEETLENVRVEEERAEGNLTHSWNVSDKLSFQTSLGAEYSRLSVVSTDEPSREFVRPKGFLSASYKVSPKYTLRARAERAVGQLDFGTFVSTVNFTDDIANAGNNLIVPTQQWNTSVEVQRIDDKVLSGTLRLFAEFIEDPIDQILFIDGTQGPGNLDNSFRYGAEVNGTWLLDSYGFKGGRIDFDAGLRDSTIDDPITNTQRAINRT